MCDSHIYEHVEHLSRPSPADLTQTEIENHAAAVALYVMWYKRWPRASDASRDSDDGAGVTDHVWSAEEIIGLMEA